VADGTEISWASTTLNISSGCKKCSEGCLNCYIERTPPFRMAGRKFIGDGIGAETDIQLHLERLALPLRWHKPRTIFVNSLSDLFHKEIPDEVIARLWIVMALTPRHIYQVLTKRPARMRALLNSGQRWQRLLNEALRWIIENVDARMPVADVDRVQAWINEPETLDDELLPLENVWLGTSAENQKWADVRIPQLLMAPAAVHFISAEPLLGPIDLTRIAYKAGGGTHLDVVNGHHGVPGLWRSPAKRLDWVITGGESGPNARPMHPDWARQLRDQCAAGGVAFHFKQHGEWAPIGPLYCKDDGPGSIADEARTEAVHLEVAKRRQVIQLERDGCIVDDHQPGDPRTWLMAKVGKKTAGRKLDGCEHNALPGRAA
jgi:protein gp37